MVVTIEFQLFELNNLFSMPSIKIQAYEGAILVPMAVPDICCLTWPLNLK